MYRFHNYSNIALALPIEVSIISLFCLDTLNLVLVYSRQNNSGCLWLRASGLDFRARHARFKLCAVW
jgi:hypothetical protein